MACSFKITISKIVRCIREGERYLLYQYANPLPEIKHFLHIHKFLSSGSHRPSSHSLWLGLLDCLSNWIFRIILQLYNQQQHMIILRGDISNFGNFLQLFIQPFIKNYITIQNLSQIRLRSRHIKKVGNGTNKFSTHVEFILQCHVIYQKSSLLTNIR